MIALTIVFLLVVVIATFVDGHPGFRTVSGRTPSKATFGLVQAHRLFCDLFDAIYGASMWSAQRLVMSVVSTLIGLAITVIAIGPPETVFGIVGQSMGDEASSKGEAVTLAVATVLLAFFLNFVPDFFSLAETRFVLRLAGRVHPNWILLLVPLDLLLTTAIFMLGPLLVLVFVGGLGGHEILNLTLTRSALLPFFLTTFLTSMLWILYACSVASIRWLSVHRITREIVHAMARSNYPTVAFSLLANIVVAVLWWPFTMLFVIVAGPALPTHEDGGREPPIDIGRTYRASFVERTDYSVTFRANEGSTYVVEATPIVNGDTVLHVLERGSDSAVASDDDCGVGLGSRLVLNSDAQEEYLIHIASYDDQKTPASEFTFSVRESEPREFPSGRDSCPT